MPKRGEPPFLFFLALLASVALFFLSALLAPKPDLENARPNALGDFQFPTATEGRALPVVWGSAKVKGANTVWYGDLGVWPIREKIKTGMFSSERITVGFEYTVGYDQAICVGPIDFISEIEIGDKVIFEDANISAGGDPDGAQYTINEPDIWGGFKKGGGITGNFQIYDGVTNQNPDAYMLTRVNQNVSWGVSDPPGTNKSLPGYNRLCHVVWKGGNIGESTNVRNWAFTIHRYPNPLGLTSDRHKIREDAEGRADANPMNVIYEILTDTDFGLGINPFLIETSEFIAAANTLATEENGFSMTVDSQKKARDIISEVERQVDGVLYQTADGRVHFALARFDYTPAALEVFDETKVIEVSEYTRASWDETQNSVHIKYTDRTDGFKDTAAVAQDMANVEIQGREVKAQVNFPGIKHPDTAADVAARELKQYAFPLARVTLVCNRQAADLLPGDVFKWTWPRYGIVEMVLRVADVSLGSLTNGKVKVVAYQDIFALGQTVFTGGGASLAQNLDATAVAVMTQRVTGVPFWFLQDDDSIDVSTVGERALVLAEAPSSTSTAFDIYGDIDAGAPQDFQLVGRSNSMTPTGELQAIYGKEEGMTAGGRDLTTGFTIENVVWATQPDDVTANSIRDFGFGLLMVNDEIIAYENISDNGDGTYDVTRIHRALLDTVNEEHAAGSKVWFIRLGGAPTSTDILFSPFTFRLSSQTITDSLDVASAPDIAHTLDQRQDRPLRMAYLRGNGSAVDAAIADNDLSLTWRRRGTTQTLIVDDDSADETTGLPDNYVLEFRKRDYLGSLGSVFDTQVLASSATSYNYPRATFLVDAGGIVAGETIHVTAFARDTGPVDSFDSWVREFEPDAGGLTSVSTDSILLNGTTPATEQQYVEGPAMTTMWASDPTAVSYSCWIKFNDTEADDDMLLGATADYNDRDDGFGVQIDTAATPDFKVWFGDVDGGSGGATAVCSATDLVDGNWHHLAVTWDTVTNQTPRVWVDGVELTPTASSSRNTAIVRGGTFDIGRVGAANAPAAGFVNVEFDEVALYEDILTDLQVRQIHGGGAPADLDTFGPTADLLLWWRCGEDASDDATAGTGQVTDVGTNGNNYHGTPQAASGNPSFTTDVP